MIPMQHRWVVTSRCEHARLRSDLGPGQFPLHASVRAAPRMTEEHAAEHRFRRRG